MAPYAQGLALYGGYAYVGLWNFVAVVCLTNFTIVNVFSASEMADIHSIAADRERLYILSTASECISCFSRKTYKKIWQWGPNEKILEGGGLAVLPSVQSRFYMSVLRKLGLARLVRTPAYRGEELRYIHKSRSRYYRHHVNNILLHNNNLYINTKGWFDTSSSSVICMDLETKRSRWLAEPGSFIGSHDGVIRNGNLYVTEADNSSLAWINLASKCIERVPLNPAGYFIRGLVEYGGSWIIGFTPRRGSGHELMLGIYDKSTLEHQEAIVIPSLHGPDGTAIHSIMVAHGVTDD
ncbi:NHL repeat-containing protein [Kineobactrum salinum]|uniref:Uncharacterized protein n=1 Tax=Kineobactrum salinum TaxID=2708301 RepID=A0A6C0U1I6_9GAMM|nr:hypothetical protein [Kineobactrum salinum]QIB65970.1 hypothetical protein G3T16_11615 [Kineobactrum salinum]